MTLQSRIEKRIEQESEKWVSIPNYEGHYEVSSLGKIRSVKKHPFKFMKPRKRKDGYLNISLGKNNQKKQLFVHRIVLLAFIGPCPKDLVAAHLNGNPSDNRLANLKWASKKENAEHAIIHNRYKHGEQIPYSKLTQKQVNDIRREYKNKKSSRYLGKKYGVNKSTILRIINGVTWKDRKLQIADLSKVHALQKLEAWADGKE